MRFVGKSKIGRLSAKKGKIYPQIRLPAHLGGIIGEVADVFETERNAWLTVLCHVAQVLTKIGVEMTQMDQVELLPIKLLICNQSVRR